MNIFAIGDIHGCLKELTSLHKKILSHEKYDVKKDVIIYLGDYIDRGKYSKEVIDQIIKLKEKEIKTINLMGNHDEFMINFLFNGINNLKTWINYGADFTFRSYGIELVEYIKDGFNDDVIKKVRDRLMKNMGDNHFNFFKKLKLFYQTDKYLFVHAGIDPKKKLFEQTKEDYLWSRSSIFFDKNFKADKIIVHGHTPEEKTTNDPFRINIDSGCYFSGKLTCVGLTDELDTRFFLTN